jgi:hypothetical protein
MWSVRTREPGSTLVHKQTTKGSKQTTSTLVAKFQSKPLNEKNIYIYYLQFYIYLYIVYIYIVCI